MTARAAAIIALVALAFGAASTSCFVNRQSDGFACETTVDCGADRICDRGYCVQTPCPSQCTDCDLSDRTCEIACSAGRPCGTIQCPVGYACSIRCVNSNACDDIDCAEGLGCQIDCAGASSCGAINCGKAACDIDCSGPQACPAIDCVDACRCDVSCGNPSVACPAMSCPLRGATLCTKNGIPGERCDSSEDALCDSCQD